MNESTSSEITKAINWAMPNPIDRITVAQAMERLAKAVHEEYGPGTYRDGWLANIAMPIIDHPELDLRHHAGANKMAEILLDHFFPKPQ